MGMAKETEPGLGFRVKIQKNGTVVVPAWVRKMVDRSYGEEIDLIAPKNQTSEKRIAKQEA
jgi:bifunctional DNA-binding transcriptional regulator/antitoxin component of YhaV-PrlF toxin-antitoxin module